MSDEGTRIRADAEPGVQSADQTLDHRPQAGPPGPSSSRITHHASLAALVVLLAAALRLFALDRVPPGLFYDESANGVDALRVLAGAHPIFFSGNQGREPLLIYLQAAALAVVGPSPLALRLPSAMIGVLTVPASFATFRGLFGRRVGLITAFLVAVSYWHLSVSRLAFSADAVPLFATLAAFWFWKAVHTGRARHFAVAGFLLGVDLYTYIPSRLVPVLFAGWFLGFLLLPTWRKNISTTRLLSGGLVMLALFALTVFPLVRHFYTHPHDFTGRIHAEEQSAEGFQTMRSFAQAVDALVQTGDPNPRHNLPGRPLLDFPIVIAALLGVVVAARCWRDGASVFILVWSLAMLAPAALSREPAHALRLVGEIPFIFAIAALGVDWLTRVRLPKRPTSSCSDMSNLASSAPFDASRITFARVSRVAPGSVVVVIALALVGASTVRDYFVVWATSPATHHAFEASALHAPSLLSQVPPDSTVFATADAYEGKPIPLSFIPGIASRVRAYDGRDVFVTPSDILKPAYYIYAREYLPDSGIPPADHLTLVATSRDGNGQIEGELFRMAPPLTSPAPARPADALIGTAIKVTGEDVQPVVGPGQSLHFAVHWTVVGHLPPGDWAFFAHLVERNNQQVLGQDYNHGFPPNQWRVGDRVVTSFTIPVPAEAPAAVADVAVGMFDQTTGRRLLLTDPAGKPAGSALICGPVRIDRPVTIPPASRPLDVRFGQSMTLLGYDLERPTANVISLRLHWRTSQPIDHDYTVFVHLVDGQGHLIATGDSEPDDRAFPTSTWKVGEDVLDMHRLQSPRSLPPGSHLEVGVYLLATGQRLPAFTTEGASRGDSIEILL